MVTNRGFRATRVQQRDACIYLFAITAEQLLEYGRVERFGIDEHGVNRLYDDRHAKDIAEAMVQPHTVMMESICGDLSAGWTFNNGWLIPSEGAFISLDDGQHRYGACQVLGAAERRRWSFAAMATQGVDFQARMRIFRQQRQRKTIDRRLDLAQRWFLDDWGGENEKEAYGLVLSLNADNDSPLHGMIILKETIDRKYAGQHRPEGLSSSGLWYTLKSVTGKGSPLNAVTAERRAEVVQNMLVAASDVWTHAWNSKTHVLVSARGINGVLMLLVSGSQFRIAIGDDFRLDSLRSALGLAKTFNWTSRARRGDAQKVITMELDAAIGRNYRRQFDTGERVITT